MSSQILNYKDVHTSQGDPPVFVLHGVFGSLDNWYTLAKQLAEKYRVILVDLRNHGQSFHDDQFDYPTMVADIFVLADHLKIENFHLVGHSMGGKVAMLAAQTLPQRILTLTVVDIAPKVYPPHHQQILQAMREANLVSATSRKEIEDGMATLIPEAGVRLFIMKNIKREKEGFAWKINLPVIEKNITEIGKDLEGREKYNGPVLFIKGSESHYINVSDASLIADRFPNYDLEVVDGANHWVHAVKPKETLEAMLSFLDKNA
jgi:pimeloyl-ACP methyl ester carboxylesterase